MTISSILLVDKRIQDYETIVAAVKADGVQSIVFDVNNVDDVCRQASSSSSFQYILGEIAKLGVTSFSNIGIVQHNTGAPFHRFFAETQGEESVVAGVETADPTLQSWAGFAAFVTALKNTYGVQNVDLMACALYSDPNWKYIIDTLAVQTEVGIRASTDDTGSAALGGNWFLESHTGVNLKDVYFTEAIENFRGLLFYTTKYDYTCDQPTKSFAVGKAFAWGYQTWGGDSSSTTGTGNLSSNIVAIYSNGSVFAALTTSGGVITWGESTSGANQTVSGSGASVASSLTSGVVKIFSARYALVALKTDGTCIVWGDSTYGGNSSGVTLTNVVDVYPSFYKFAVLKSNGSVQTWGHSSYGSDSSSVASLISSNVVSVNMSTYAGAALKKDGRVITWGTGGLGNDSTAVAASLTSGVVVVVTDNQYSYAALKNNGTVITWGYTGAGFILSSSVNLNNIVSVFTNGYAYAALKQDGSVVTWGHNSYGGDSTGKGLSTAKVVSICGGVNSAFAALTSTGTVITWGYGSPANSSTVSASLTNVIAIYSNSFSFAALKSNGQVITWGNASYGADSSAVSNDISANVVAVYPSDSAFAALRKDGRVIVWGSSTSGGAFSTYIPSGGTTRAVTGGDLNSGIVSVNNTNTAFAAIQSTATTFDLSASYYTDNDRYDILRNKENRRRVNLTTLNNNVFTLSSTRDIERFNYMIPSSAGPFRIIVPDFVDSSYSITSTATVPGAVSTNYIIACEEGEPVTISGTTYINYGAFVYIRNADNTFTKTITATIGGVTYSLYGGDGINSSGIALRYRLGPLTIPTKSVSDASFNLTEPVSDSSGSITYTSSNSGVATVTTDGTVTVVGGGTATITATRAGGSNYALEGTGLIGSTFVTASAAVANQPWQAVSLSSTGQYQTAAIYNGWIITSYDYGVTWISRASTAGSRYWFSVSLSSNGQYQTATVSAVSGYIWTSSDYGVNWTSRLTDTSRALTCVSLSSTGQYQTVADNTPGLLWTSSDYGVTWTSRATSSYWRAVSLSSTGQYQTAVVSNGGNIWTSSDYGVTWTDRGNTALYWRSVSISSSGQYQTAVIDNGNIWTSSDYGVSWTSRASALRWWSVSLSSTGQYQTASTWNAATANLIYTSSDYGVTWTGRASALDWRNVSVSSSGQYQTAVVNSGSIYFSRDYGITWSTTASYEVLAPTVTKAITASSTRNWYRISLSSTGQYHTAVVYSGGYIYTSSDYGVTFTERTAAGARMWFSVSLSSTGQYQTAVVANGNIYTSSDYGATWTARTAAGSFNWQSISVSGTGQYQTAMIYGGTINTSSDYGATWTARTTPGNRNWNSISVSSTGQYQTAVVYNGSVWTSSDNGVTWTDRGTSSGTRNWFSISISSNGDYQTAAVGELGNIWTSSNYGVTWTDRGSSSGTRRWQTVSISSTGQYQTAVSQNATNIYTSSDYGVTWTARGSSLSWQSVSISSTGQYQSALVSNGQIYFSTDYGITWSTTASYEFASVSATLTVNKLTSTLGALTVPAKFTNDAPFALTAPTSSISSIISPINTITSTASVIVTFPDINAMVIGSSWSQLGLDISGTQVNEYSGLSVSMSADGTIIAIGSQLYDKAGGTTNANTDEGRTRIYKYNGTSWSQLGLDVSGTQVNEQSGTSVSLSADGMTVAIGSYYYDTALTDVGRTRIYRYNGSVWAQLGSDISGNQAFENSGYSVSLSADGTTVAIGSRTYNVTGADEGRTRIYRYNGTSWGQLGLDISGTQVNEQSGWSVSLSADGTTVAMGARYYDTALADVGRTRVYRYNSTTSSWGQLGLDISGTQASENSGYSVSLSADGTIVAIGSYVYSVTGTNAEGRTRIYRYNGTSWGQLGLDISGSQAGEYSGTSVSLSADGTIVAIGSYSYDTTVADVGRTRIYRYNGTSWGQLGLDISGTQNAEYSGTSVCLSSDGTTVVIGSYLYDKAGGTTASNTNEGRTRIYRLPTTNAITYTNSNSSIADVCGNLLLIKGVNGTSTITASQTGNTVTGRLDVSGTTYTLQYNPFTYTSSNTSVATVSTYGTVTLTGTVGTSTITATQPETLTYTSQSVTGSLVVSKFSSTLGALTVPAKVINDAPFALTAPTSSISSIISPVNTITSTASVIVPPSTDIRDISYGTTWIQRGADIDGQVTDDRFGYSVSMSASGTVLAAGAYYNDGGGASTDNRGNTRVFDLVGNTWTQRGGDIIGEAADDQSGFSVNLSANGNIVAIGARYNDGSALNAGHVRVYRSTPGKPAVTSQTDPSFGPIGWTRLGGDIDGEAQNDYSGWSVSLSADGTIVAIGGYGNDANDNGHVRVYRYTPTKTQAVTNQSDISFGPVGWNRLGGDIDGITGSQSGMSTALSADGTIVAIGGPYADLSSNDNRGVVRVYRYNALKTSPQLTDSNVTTFGPAGWDRIGNDIFGEAANDLSAYYSIGLSANGNTVAIGSHQNAGPGSGTDYYGSVRIYDLSTNNTWIKRGQDIDGEALNDQSGSAVCISADGNIVAIGARYNDGTVASSNRGHVRIYAWNGSTWVQRGQDIDGEAAGDWGGEGSSVSLSADGSRVAIGASWNDGTVAGSDRGHVRVYDISVNNPITYSNSNSSIADVCGNLLLIKGVNGTSTITATQSGNTVTGRLDVSGTTYTLQYYPFTYTSSNTSVATVSTYGTVTLTGTVGTSTITATQPETLTYTSQSVTGSLVVSLIAPTIGALTVPTKNFGDASFNLTAPTSNSNGAFTYTSSAPGVATVTTGGTVTIVSAGTTTIRATQDASGNYTTGSVTASLVVSPITPTYQSISQVTKTYGTDVSFSLTAVMSGVSNSDGAYTFSTTSAAIDICGGVATILAYTPSAITITATQAAYGNYNASGSTTFTLLVNRKTPSYGAFSIPAATYEDAPFSIAPYAPTTDSTSIPFTYTSSEPTVATINSDGTVITIIGQGYTTITASQVAGGNYTSGSVTTSFLVNRAAPTFLKAFTIPDKTFGDAPFSLLPFTEGLDNTDGTYRFSVSSSNAQLVSISEVDGVTATIHAYTPTPVTIYVAIDACGNYAASSTSGTLNVVRATPNIGALTVPAKNFGDASFNLTAPTSNSNGAFTYSSSAPEVATVTSGGTVTILKAGTTTITATQDVSGNYTTGSVTASLVVSPIAPNIGTLTVPAKNFGDASFNLTAPTSNSDGAFTYSSSAPSVATVTSGGRVTVVGAGTTTITATQDASGNYTTGSVTGSLVVSPIAPNIGTLTPPAKNFGDASFNLTAPTSNSDGAFTYTSSTPSVATVTSGGRVTVVGAGTTTITATQDASGNYTTGSVTGSLVVSPIAPNIGTLTVPAKNFGDASFNLTAPTSNSDGAFTYSSSAPSVATVTSGGRVTILKAGTTTITATQDASGNYITGSVTASLVISPIAPNIDTLTVPAKNFGDASFNLTAPTSNSDGAFTYSSSAPGVATVTSGGRVTVVGAGTTTITATQDASGNYTTGSVTGSLVVSPIAPNIGVLTPPAKNFGDASFNLTAPTSNSDGAFTYSSSTPSVATVTSGGRVTIVGAGTTTITATQEASENYIGGSVTGSLVVSPIAPNIGTLTVPAKNFGDASFNLTAPTSNSGGVFTYTSSAPGVATVTSGGTVTVVGAGTTTITATQEASGNYIGGSVTASLVVSPITPTYQSISQVTKTYGTDVSFSLTAVMSGVSNSDGAYTFSTTSAAIDICGGVATILAYTPSAITITATQAAYGNYNASGSKTFTLLVNRKTPSYGAFSIPAATYEDAPFSIAAYAPTTDSTSVPFTYTSSDPTVATINSDGTVITIIGQGYTTITASQDASGNYAAGSVTTSFLVNRAAPTFLKAFTIPDKTFGDAPFSLLPFTEGLDNTDGTYHFSVTSSNAQLVSISEVDGVTATIHAYTPTPITIYVAIDACGNYAASSTSGTLNVVRASPNIGTLTVPAKNFGDASFNLTAPTSSSDGAFTYSSSAPSVATVTSGGTVTILKAGTTTITATQDVSGNYTGGSVTASLVVSPIAPNIGTLTPPAKNFGDASFNLTAPTSNSDGAFTYSSSAPSVATVTSGGRVTILKAGTTTITATQDASGNYTTGSVTGSLVISPIAPNIGVLAPPAKNFGDASFNLTAPTSNSDGAFTYSSSAPSVATVTSGGRVTVVGAGTTTITATQEASGNYVGGSVTGSLVVSPIAPNIDPLTAPAKNFGDASFNLTAPTSNSDGAFTYSSSTPSVATVTSGGRVTVVGAGTTTITATQEASGNYIGGSVTASLVVSPIAPNIDTLTVPAKNFGDASFNLTAPTSNSNGAFTYSSSAPSVATVTSGGRVTVVGAGTTTITATQEASGNYIGGSVTASLVVSPITPTYQSISQITKTYGMDVSFSLTAIMSGVSNSDGAYTFSTTSAAIDICGGVATILAYTPSAITITATQAAYGNYNASGSKTFTLLVNRKTPSYGTFSIPAVTYGDVPFSIAAYAPTTDSIGVPFTYTSSNTDVATINSDGTVITIIGQGYTTITASQVAGGNYGAGSVTTSFLVNRAAPTFLKLFTIPDKTFGDASFSLLPFTEGLDNTDGTYHFSSSNAELVSISASDGVTATIHAYTPTPITIYVAIDACGNYAASSTSGTLTVARATPSIGALTVPAKNFGDASFNLTAPTSNSNGVVTFSSSAPGVATVTSGGTVTILKAGTTTITATQDASGNYTGGSVSASLVVSPIAPNIGTLTAPAKNLGDASFNLTAPTSNSDGAFTYSSSAPSVATVTSGGTVTIVNVGTTTITATQDASGNYTTGSVTASLVVSASLGNFTVPSGKVYGDASFNLTDPSTIDNTVGFTFTSSNSSVATISGRTVTIVGAGSSVITASQAATDSRAQMDISATLVVAPAVPVITLAAITKTYGATSFLLAPSSTNTDDVSGTGFSFTSNNTSVASIIDSSFVKINGVGSAVIAISQAATANFTDGSGSVVITVSKATPSLSTFSVSANKTYGSAPFSILTAPTSGSDGAITYSSSNTSVATIDNSGVITLVASGYVNFTATQAATELYNSATKTSNTMTVHRQSIFLTRSSPSVEVVNKTYGDDYFVVSATNAAEGAALTYESDNPNVATVINASTGVISIVSVGTATITASRAQTAQYTSVPVSWTIQVGRTTTTLTGLTDLSYNITVQPIFVVASSASNGAVTYALQDPTSDILTIHPTSGLIRLLSPGSAVIVASQAQGALYEAPDSISATITVTPAGNALEGLTLTTAANYSDVNLNDAIINNANINGSNFAGAKLSGATFTTASIIGATFTNATLVRANLSGISISQTNFTNADLSGATLTGVDASGTIFTSAKLNNVDLTGANVTNVNFTNTSIKGATITDVSFSSLQKLQLLKHVDNRDISAIIVSSVPGPTLLAAISESSPVRSIASNLDLSNNATTVAVFIPQTSTSPTEPITDISLDVVNHTMFYLPINHGEYFRINGEVYYSSSGVIHNYTTNEVVEVITYEGKPIWLFSGSVVGVILETNTLSSSSFVVPSSKLTTDTSSFMPITLPTSNSNAPIVYSSSNTNIATINATTGQITVTGNGNGIVTFTATQLQNETYGPGTITSNTLLVDQSIHLTLPGLNQSFNLSTLATLEELNAIADTTDATAVIYVKLSNLTDIFKYQTDAVDINDISATDLKYYVFHRKWPTELKINPSHAMMNKIESSGMLGSAQLFTEDKMLVKHDFIRYLSLRLFNTIHGVDLFVNETDLQENATYYGESIRNNIHQIMSGISTTSSDETMAYDASGNKYLTNSASGNTNLCRELMRQIAASVASRFYNNGADDTGLKTVPLRAEDTITFKVTIQAAETQNVLTGVSEIPSRSYTIKLVLKSSVTTPNTAVTDSEMFPNAYPYSSSVTSIEPDSEAAATVYNIYSPPAPIPFTRFGFNGWYYTNSSAWVNVNSNVRNHVKWLVSPNNVGSSTVGTLQYIRVNMKLYNKTSVPYLMVYTQSGSWRKYIASPGGGVSLNNGTVYSFYMNFNSYAREPAIIGHTNIAYANSLGSGSFGNNEFITSIAVETDSGAAAGAVEFTLESIIVGELASGVPSEKEYGFMALVPSAYP